MHNPLELYSLRVIPESEEGAISVTNLLVKEFFALRLKKDESISDFMVRVEFLFGQLEDMVVTEVDQATLIDTIICGLPSYQAFMSSWNDHPDERQTFNELIGRLIAEQLQVNKYQKKSKIENALVASTSRKQTKGKPRHKGKKKSYCFICKSKEHFMTDCSKFDPNYKSKKSQDKGAGSQESKNDSIAERSNSDVKYIPRRMVYNITLVTDVHPVYYRNFSHYFDTSQALAKLQQMREDSMKKIDQATQEKQAIMNRTNQQIQVLEAKSSLDISDELSIPYKEWALFVSSIILLSVVYKLRKCYVVIRMTKRKGKLEAARGRSRSAQGQLQNLYYHSQRCSTRRPTTGQELVPYPSSAC